MTMEHTQHVSVMPDEVLEYLQPRPGGLYIDGTLGGGGHTAALLERSAPDGKVLGIDTDTQALARVGERLAEFVASGRLVLAHGNFSDLERIVAETGFGAGRAIQGILLDLGFSSDQMDNPERGFAFSSDGPLDMRLDQTAPLTAADLVNGVSEQELADIFWRYGEETRSRPIARRIVRAREKGAITRTAQLANLIAAGVPHKPGAIHPATRAFQALRIAVNRELERLETVLPQIVNVLEREKMSDGGGMGAGRMVIIAFHSLEDRIVKEFIRREAKDCICPPRLPVCVCGHKARLRNLTNKPVTPGEQEIARNPRARSAKLRAAEIAIDS
ncbi:ribosomal RNA small subunit methyltransferase H [Dictyobacter alpinus]|uniref:Ribosomal RNA small subunit methyltransferase H n=1 Tax=Dictyobacter alpinus TaxID=2014873 RepID=A0A402B3K3_9CHLR|nr:ribosomal RNA small subunit methyltransferase H [Dictyobacter alpinus]